MRKFINYLIITTVFLTFLVKVAILLDPDFGWHVRTGQLILTSGVPKTDPFSYTMPNFPFVDHGWLTDVLLAKTQLMSGRSILPVLASLLVLGTVLILTRNRILALLALGSIFSFTSIRPLIFSWLFFSLLLWLIFHPETYQKLRWKVPLLFLLWANLHGGFVTGLILLVFFDPLIFLVSLLTTLINPYLFGLWREIWSTLSDVALHGSIAEWQPSFFWLNPSFIFLTLLSFTTVFCFWRKYSPKQLILFFLFFIFSLTAVRNIPFFVFFAALTADQGWNFFREEIRNDSVSVKKFALAKHYLFWISVVMLFFSLPFILSDSVKFSEKSYYPVKVISYLHQNLPVGNLFSTYGWGGYLIWKLPEKKVFVDGRMPSWQQNGYSAFREYDQIVRGKIDYKPVFAKYHIDTVLWPNIKENSDNPLDKIQNRLNTAFNTQPDKNNFPESLKKDNWQKIYQDQTAVIYVKPATF